MNTEIKSAIWAVRRERRHWRDTRSPRQTVVHLPTGERVWVSDIDDVDAASRAKRVKAALVAEHGDLAAVELKGNSFDSLMATIEKAEAPNVDPRGDQ